MADDVSAGRLHLDAVADTSGFARDTKAKIDAELKNVRARIKVELDDRGIISQAQATAKKAQQAAVVRLRAELDSRGLLTQAQKAAAAASNKAKVKINADIDQAKFQASLAAAVARMDGKYKVTVGVDANVAAAEARMAQFRASQRNLPITLGANINTGNLGSIITQFSKFPALAGGVFLLGSAVGSLAGGLMAVASSAAQAVTTVAALPNLLGAVAQAGAVLLTGFSGIGGAITELGEADAASASTTQTAAKVRTDSARRVADAQRSLQDAYRGVGSAARGVESAEQALVQARHAAADATRQAGFAVQDAEWGLARAHESAREAQEALNEARREARENLDELHESLRRSALTEAQASNALAKARQDLQDVMWDEASTSQERKDAQLAVREAKVGLAEQRDAHKDLAAEVAKANREGVAGSEAVQSAQDAVRDANHNVMLSERQLSEARHSAADTARQNAASIAAAQQGVADAEMALADAHRRVADAQRGVADARRGGTEAIQAQNMALADQTTEFDKLTPAAQRFARFLFDRVMPRFDRLRDNIQEAILPPIQKGITLAMPLIDTLEEGLLGTADVVGDLAVRVGRLFGSDGFNRDTAAIMDSNNKVLRQFGRAAFNLIKILSDVAVVAGPTLAQPFARWVAQVTRGWKASVQLGRETGTLRERFIRARESAGLLASIMGNLARMIHGVGKAATPVGNQLLRTFDRASERWANWANSDAGQRRMEQFFEAIRPSFEQLMTLIGKLGQSLILMGEAGGGPLTGFLMGLNAILSGLNAVLGTPYLGAFVGWLLTIAGLAGALGMVSGIMLTMSRHMLLLAKVSGLTMLWNAFRASLLYTRLGLIALAVQARVATVAATVMTGVTRGLGIAMRFALGPIGLIITAIALLVAGVIWAYRRFEGFRKVVDAVFKFIVDAAKWLYDVLFGHSIFPDMLRGFMVIFRAIWGVIRGWWGLVSGIFRTVMTVSVAVGKAFMALYNKYVKPYMDDIGAIIGIVWKQKIKPVWDALVKFVTKDIPNAFRAARDGIKDIWEDLKGIASDPVEFIVNTVYNDGIRKVINAIPGVSDLPTLSFSGFKTGGVLPGYTPGRDVHKFVSPTGGGLELSGGEAIMRPEWTKAIGTRGIEMMNRAARRGGNALAGLLAGGHEKHAMGGVYSGVERTLKFFLGGIMPLQGGVLTNNHGLPYYGATFAGDLNSAGDLASPPSAVRAWKAGQVAQVNYWPDSYGNHVILNHGAQSSLYAHLSSIIARVGQSLRAGQMLGRVGDSGNSYGAHLHFETRGGAAPTGSTGSGSGMSAADRRRAAAKAKGEKEKDSWMDAVGSIKNAIGAIPNMLSRLGNIGGWGPLMLDSIRDVGRNVISWINDKIPNSISIPGPNIPLPDSPIPNIFDRGGDWRHGSAGVNLSGKTETVFTNENVLDLTGDLARIASGLRAQTIERVERGGAAAAMIENLTLQAAPDKVPQVLGDLQHVLRVLSLGGVHAKRVAGAPV